MSERVEGTSELDPSDSAVVRHVQGAPTQIQARDERSGVQRLRRERAFEVAAAIALAVVAVATAWSGYQATRWTDAQSARYAQASARRVEATRDATLAGSYVCTTRCWSTTG